jgi:hypothetical protein
VEQITDRDRQIMRQAGGKIVRHIATGMIGHAYPWHTAEELDDYTVEVDYARSDGATRVAYTTPGRSPL